MKVFLSYAVGPWDTPIAARLRAVAAAYDVTIFLPDRTQVIHNGLPVDTQKKIKESDAVIALITNSATQEAIAVVNRELQTTTQARKPIIGLVERGSVLFQPATPDLQIVYFDRSMPTAHETDLLRALEFIKTKKDLIALGWIAGIALGLIALGTIFSDEK